MELNEVVPCDLDHCMPVYRDAQFERLNTAVRIAAVRDRLPEAIVNQGVEKLNRLPCFGREGCPRLQVAADVLGEHGVIIVSPPSV
jgi:hypothetical protein